jgi:hypothetical protein
MGRGRRAYSKQHRVKVPTVDRILFLKKNLTHPEAVKHEIYMIAVLGRKDLGTGILRNLTNGGEGVPGNNKGIMTVIARNPDHQKQAFQKILEKDPDHQKKAGTIGGKTRHEKHPDLSSNTMTETNQVKVQCTLTGHISNYGGLAKWQKARGIDTSNRRVLG